MWWIGLAFGGDLPEGIIAVEEVAWKSVVAAEYLLTDETMALESVSCLAETTFLVDGSVKVAAVGGCPEPIAGAVHTALEASIAKKAYAAVTPSAVVLVKLMRPAIWRNAKEETSLGAAIHVEKPEKYYDKPPFRPPEVKPGSCDVELWVNAEGEPYAIDMRRCRANLVLGIQGAVSQWRYTPVVQDGVAVPVRFMDSVAVTATFGR